MCVRLSQVRMYVYTYVHIYVHMNVPLHVCVHTYMSVCRREIASRLVGSIK